MAGLLALMLLTDARRLARTGPGGALLPLGEQDRGRWDAAAITEGVAILTRALSQAPIGPFQLQGAGLAALDELAGDPVLAPHHRTAAVRAHLLEMAGDADGARAHYRQAARLTLSLPEQHYLESRAARLR